MFFFLKQEDLEVSRVARGGGGWYKEEIMGSRGPGEYRIPLGYLEQGGMGALPHMHLAGCPPPPPPPGRQ